MGMLVQPISGVRSDGNPSFCASRGGSRRARRESIVSRAAGSGGGSNAFRWCRSRRPPPICLRPGRRYQYSGACVPKLQRYGGGIKASLSEGSEHHHPSRARHPIAPFFPLTHLPRDVHRRQQRAALGAVPQRPGACGDCVGRRRRLTLRSSRRCGRTQRTVCTGRTTTAARTPRWTSSRKTTSGTSTSARSRSSTTWARSRPPAPCRRRT
jgi:hypothetical protein